MVLLEHLHDKETYKMLTQQEAEEELKKLQNETTKLFLKNNPFLTDHENDYFRAFILKNPTKLRIPQFYGNPKVHNVNN